MANNKLAIIGGSGLYDVEQFKDRELLDLNTPWGKPSDKILKAIYKNKNEKNEIKNSIANIEKKFKGKKVVTFLKKFEKFYPAEDYHQDYYQEKFMNYLLYKKACGREKTLEKIWKN